MLRVEAAVDATFAQYERHADTILGKLLGLERKRVAQLLRSVVDKDHERDGFRVEMLEEQCHTSIAGLKLKMRIDRVDRLDDDSLFILDYKTGSRKQFLDRDSNPRDYQVVVYALALESPVSGLGLYNVDSRETILDAASRSTLGDTEWTEALSRWKESVEQAAKNIAAGDIRLARYQGILDARPLSLLSRFAEVRDDA